MTITRAAFSEVWAACKAANVTTLLDGNALFTADEVECNLTEPTDAEWSSAEMQDALRGVCRSTAKSFAGSPNAEQRALAPLFTALLGAAQ